MILESVFVLEGLRANVAREAWRSRIVNGKVLCQARRQRKSLCADRTLVRLVIVIELVILQAVFAPVGRESHNIGSPRKKFKKHT